MSQSPGDWESRDGATAWAGKALGQWLAGERVFPPPPPPLRAVWTANLRGMLQPFGLSE